MKRTQRDEDSSRARTLDEDNLDLLRALDQLVRAYQFRDRHRSCHQGLSLNECYALQTIIRRDGMTQNELATELLLDKSTTSRLIARMEEAGRIERAPDAADGRAQRLHATRAGEQLHARIEQDLLDRQRELIADLPPARRRAAVLVLERLGRMATEAFSELRPGPSREGEER